RGYRLAHRGADFHSGISETPGPRCPGYHRPERLSADRVQRSGFKARRNIKRLPDGKLRAPNAPNSDRSGSPDSPPCSTAKERTSIPAAETRIGPSVAGSREKPR